MTVSKEQKDVRDVLVGAYIEYRGKEPSDGGWIPNEDVLDKIRNIREKRGDEYINNFLRQSVHYHCWMTSDDRGKPTPFFINQHLFSSKRLEGLKKHQDVLKEMGTSNAPGAFEGTILAEIRKHEMDYLNLASFYCWSGSKMNMIIINPGPYWAVVSREIERTTSQDESKWEHSAVKYDGRMMRFHEATSILRTKLRQSKAMRDFVMIRGVSIMEDATKAWLSNIHVVNFYPDVITGQKTIVGNTDFQQDLIRIVKPAIDRDHRLFEEVKRILQTRNHEFRKPSTCIDGEYNAPPSTRTAHFRRGIFDAAMAKMIDDTILD